MDILLIAAIVFIALIALGYPLVNPREYRFALGSRRGNGQLEHLENARRQVLDAIRDLQFDNMTGKLSDADYQSLRAQYEVQAAQILQQLDKFKGQTPLPDKAAPSCPRCHAPMDAADKFCVKCGTKIVNEPMRQ
jgi:hypothetical protein